MHSGASFNWKIVEGDPRKPFVILIHGLGMNRYFWGRPENCHAFGGMVSLSRFLTNPPGPDDKSQISFGATDSASEGLGDRLSRAGFTVVSWSQQQPYGPMMTAVAELENIVAELEVKYSDKKFYFLGHSRGGLVARNYLFRNENPNVEGLITICSPHRGSGMARFVRYLKPVGVLLEKTVPAESRWEVAEALKRLADFLTSSAVAELLPDSECIRALNEPLPKHIRALSIGGTDPNLFRLYVRNGSIAPWRSYAYSDLLAKVVPHNHLPDELKDGKGDGMVTAESARSPGAACFDFHANHVGIAFSPRLQEIVLGFLQDAVGSLTY